jgi:ABC-2 type transport system ATP-binding protein
MKMELTAALLHSPEVLFLDEPTIGLDVVAQHRIQQFLRDYQERRKITVLLTSHYMKDVAALCRRVVIIAQGQIKYDGSLSGIVDQFSSQKLVTLQLANGQANSDFGRYGSLVSVEPPKVKLRIERPEVARALASILAQHTVEDVIVEDPPLEEVIAAMFSRVSG